MPHTHAITYRRRSVTPAVDKAVKQHTSPNFQRDSCTKFCKQALKKADVLALTLTLLLSHNPRVSFRLALSTAYRHY
jgi:hypothetical protein